MTLPPLPEPDTHCFDDDTGLDVWSHSPDQMRAYAEQAVAAETERCAKIAAEPQGEPKPLPEVDAVRSIETHIWTTGQLLEYAHPPQQRKPLTEVQITELAEQCGYDGAVPTVRLAFQGFKLDEFARAIERAITGETP